MDNAYQNGVCPNCGNPIPIGAEFCTNCGQRVAAANPQTPMQNPVGQPYQKQGFDMKLITRWLGLIGAAAYAGTGFLMAFVPYNLFYNFLLALHYLGEGAFMASVALFIWQKLEK